MPSRRQFLATAAAGLAGALAGCAEPDAVLEMEPLEGPADVALQATVPANPDAPPDHAALLEEVLAEGSAERGGRRPPFEPDRPVRHDGGVYGLSWTEVDEVTRTEYAVEFRYDPDEDLAADEDFEDLPEPDRDALGEFRSVLRGRAGPDRDAPDEPVEFGVERYYDAAEREASVLVPEQTVEVVRMDGLLVSVDVEPVERTVSTYRYEAEQLADSLSAYGTAVREAEEFDLEARDDAEREVIGQAIDGGYHVPGDHDDAFDRVADRLVEHDPIHVEGREGEWLVRYGGGSVWTTLYAPNRSDLAEQYQR